MSEEKERPSEQAGTEAKQETEAHTADSPPEAPKDPEVVEKNESSAAHETKPSAAPVDPEREAKLKAAAEARAARAAAKAAAEGGQPSAPDATAAPVDPEREAKLKAAAEARAARAAAKAAAEGGTPGGTSASAGETPAEPKAPSPKQPELDELLVHLRTQVGDSAVEEASINELNGHMPMLTVRPEQWLAAAQTLRSTDGGTFDYLRNVSGVDYETHLEVVYHLVSLVTKREATIKVKTNREQPSVPSVTPIWATANWNEREIYDLLGVAFPGHPDLRRIMMPDDWVGHPLRKDYVSLDSEV
ncbi:NADH-quinone oxidoreductase subunit C [Paenibacillus phyllosphaerae]|uniref:NADH-quinone oxidoreductase subunit C n=1 Tax=Paenibacillus phyllosphaerae TaxID=274593 RepID=A0A7W5FMW0_9BACL|nr:NADH-quinone oxidoreductase subunit C [Paenibacillus phyllosphaerae]MBB3110548.1 NADH-quinone oxidoreductase subunit C [Paenibacillus phyllosphaerae]